MVLTLIVCGLGIAFTYDQALDVQASLLAAEQRSARSETEFLRRRLIEQETAALARVTSELQSGLPTDGSPQACPWLRAPFIVAPREPAAEASGLAALLDDPTPPDEYAQVLRQIHGGAPLDRSVGRLEAFAMHRPASDPWRARALSHRAALELRAGDTTAASQTWNRLFDEMEEVVRGLTTPTYEALVLARAECVTDGEDSAELESLLIDAWNFLGDLPGRDAGRRLWFLREASDLVERRHAELPTALSEARVQLLRERALSSALRDLRDLLRVQARLKSEGDDELSARHTRLNAESGDIVCSWMRVARGSPSEGPLAVGYLLDADRLSEWLTQTLASPERDDGDLRVEPVTRGGLVRLARLDGDLDFLQIGVLPETWNTRVGRARRPFILAGLLISALGILLIAGLLFLYRSVRREMALARMKTDFVANVSHELKTPLALIRLCSETLQLGRLKQKARQEEYYRVITRETERLSHLISNVLNFASIEAGKKSYKLEPHDLSGVFRQTFDSYFIQCREKGFECSYDIPDVLPPVLADEEAVAQALINLLQNAVRYSPDTQRIRAEAAADESSVRVSVEDHGVGIAEEDQSKIWDDYYRTREARALGTRGSGLGLSLVQHIQKAHGGRVEVFSVPGEGCRFTLIYPRTDIRRGDENG